MVAKICKGFSYIYDKRFIKIKQKSQELVKLSKTIYIILKEKSKQIKKANKKSNQILNYNRNYVLVIFKINK